MKSIKPLSRKHNLVTQEAKGEVMIYDLYTNKAYCLNETTALVWAMCDGTKTVVEISQELTKKLNEPASEELIWLAIDQLKTENLIVNHKNLPNYFEGMNRREVIKKVGLGTMIALPVISGLLAPTAARAASNCATPNNITATNQNCASFSCANFCTAVYGAGTTTNGCTQNGADVSCACCTV